MHAYSYLLEVPGDSRLFSLYKMNKNKPQQCLQCPFLSFVMLDSKYLALLLTKALFIWRGVGPGPPPPPKPTLLCIYMEKNMSQVMMRLKYQCVRALRGANWPDEAR